MFLSHQVTKPLLAFGFRTPKERAVLFFVLLRAAFLLLLLLKHPKGHLKGTYAWGSRRALFHPVGPVSAPNKDFCLGPLGPFGSSLPFACFWHDSPVAKASKWFSPRQKSTFKEHQQMLSGSPAANTQNILDIWAIFTHLKVGHDSKT